MSLLFSPDKCIYFDMKLIKLPEQFFPYTAAPLAD